MFRKLLPILVVFVLPLVGYADESSTAWQKKIVEKAGENGEQITKALSEIRQERREGMEFLLRYMPERDLTSLSADFLLENVDYAYQAWNQSKWKNDVPKDLFLNYVLPYANINEDRDNWRKDFYQRFSPLVKDAKSAGQAAVMLNQKVFKLTNVKYSTKRRRADQGPFESIESGLASCTGLSILLIDACRSVGIPARFVGTPLWSDRSGNHSWVEVWDNGAWHFTGAAEPAGDDLDKAWFIGRASKAKRDDRRHAIYAVSYKQTPILFPLLWDRRNNYVHAVNVTDRYANKAAELPADHLAAMFRVLNPNGERCCVPIRVKDQAGKTLFEGESKDERFDLNDHTTAVLPKGVTVEIEYGTGDEKRTKKMELSDAQPLTTLTVEEKSKSE